MYQPTLSTLKMLAKDCYSTCDNESLAKLQLRLLLIFQNLERFLGCPTITGSRFEYHIPRTGRVDLLLTHPGDGISLIEAKSGAESKTGMAGGIGQLFVYEAAIMAQKNPPAWIEKYLVIPGQSKDSGEIVSACRLAGVTFVSLASHTRMREFVKAAAIPKDQDGC